MNKIVHRLNGKFRKPLVALLVAGVTAGLFFLIGFAQINQNEKRCREIFVKIDSDYDNYFVDKNMVMKIITNDGKNPVIGKFKKEIPVTQIEKMLKKNPFVDKAEVFCDLNGNMNVTVSQKKPIARILTGSGTSYYLDEKGD